MNSVAGLQLGLRASLLAVLPVVAVRLAVGSAPAVTFRTIVPKARFNIVEMMVSVAVLSDLALALSLLIAFVGG